MNRNSLAAAIVLWLGLSACAFKPGTDPGPALQEADVVPAQATPDEVRVTWSTPELQQRTLKRKLEMVSSVLQSFRAAAPITLPAQVPDEVTLALEIPLPIAKLTDPALRSHVVALVGSDTTGREIAFRGLAFRRVDDSHSEVSLVVSGVRGMFSDTAEGLATWVYREERPDATKVAEVQIQMRTPPVIRHSQQANLGELEDEGYAFPKSVKRLETGDYRLDLLQAVEMKNDSYQKIEVSAPVKLHGKLVRFKHVVQLAPKTCSVGRQESDTSEDWPDELSVLALSADLQRNFSALAQGSNTLTATALTLAPGESGLFGIYARGESTSAWLDGTLSLTAAESVSVPDHCLTRCDEIRMPPVTNDYQSFANQWAILKPNWGQSIFAAVPYPDVQVNQCLACAQGDELSCESCRHWEETEHFYQWNGRPVPWILFCGHFSLPPDTTDLNHLIFTLRWRDEVVSTTAFQGITDGHIELQPAQDRALFSARFADQEESDDPEARVFSVLAPSFAVKTHE